MWRARFGSEGGVLGVRAIRGIQLASMVLGLTLTLSACSPGVRGGPTPPLYRNEPQALGGFPYHPLVYHLDLSVLAYQLYSQTLVWPFDPYYEKTTRSRGSRTEFMAKVRAWAEKRGPEQVNESATGLDAYRGPGVLGGFDNNARHDPILYHYGRLHPWSDTITNAVGRWALYMTPKKITRRVGDVYMCYRKTGRQEGEVVVDQVPARRDERVRNAGDVLLAFEGGTGDKGEADQPPSQSLMGFVLLRATDGAKYDVHIAFRGSRSGDGVRAVRQAFSTEKATGNPDWITDLGYDLLKPTQQENAQERRTREYISTTGGVKRGIARSMESILPQLFHCLGKAVEIKRNTSPEHIYVTGHSLGGALAQHFVSTLLLGNRYAPAVAGSEMPATLQGWPWTQIKLITFGAPRVGDAQWARALTEQGLKSEFFTSPSQLNPVDSHALAVTDPSIVPRLLDVQRPAGFRVLISRDPITTDKLGGGGAHVGKTVYLNTPRPADLLPPPDFTAHEPSVERKYMVESLADERNPPIAWMYQPMKTRVPDWDDQEAGTPEAYQSLAAAVDKFYRDNGIWFDHEAFQRDFELLFEIKGW